MVIVLMATGIFAGLAAAIGCLLLGFPLIAILAAYPAGGMAGVLGACAVLPSVPAQPRSLVRLLRQG